MLTLQLLEWMVEVQRWNVVLDLTLDLLIPKVWPLATLFCKTVVERSMRWLIVRLTKKLPTFVSAKMHALMFMYSTNITLNSVTIVNSPGYSLELFKLIVCNNRSSDSGSGVSFLYVNQTPVLWKYAIADSTTMQQQFQVKLLKLFIFKTDKLRLHKK